MSAGIPVSWPELFADAARLLAPLRERCAEVAGLAGVGGADVALFLATLDTAVAGVALLSGPDECAQVTQATLPAFEAVARDLAPDGYLMSPGELIDLLAYQHVAATCGAAPGASLDPARALTTLAGAPADTAGFELRLTLTALATGQDARAGFSPPHAFEYAPGAMFGPNAEGFVHFLRLALKAGASFADVEPGWRSFVLLFPRKLAAGTLDWPDLLLAGSVVHHRFGGLPLDQVAGRIHQTLRAMPA